MAVIVQRLGPYAVAVVTGVQIFVIPAKWLGTNGIVIFLGLM